MKWNGVTIGGGELTVDETEQSVSDNSSFTPSSGGIFTGIPDSYYADYHYRGSDWTVQFNVNGTWRGTHYDIDGVGICHGMIHDGTNVRHRNDCEATKSIRLIWMS